MNTGEFPSLDTIPTHVAIIMDGNGRWAKKRGLARLAGHQAGVENLRRVLQAAVEFGVQYLTIYAFSTENWERPQEEVQGLMSILAEVIESELDDLHERGVQLRHIGRLEQLDPDIQQKVKHAMSVTRANTNLILNIAWNYGGRDEIVYVLQELVRAGVRHEDITEELINRHLFTRESPDPDLIIRTSGEMRVSNFLIWQGAYSEYYVSEALWPDFDQAEFYKALRVFSNRERRFGKVSTTE